MHYYTIKNSNLKFPKSLLLSIIRYILSEAFFYQLIMLNQPNLVQLFNNLGSFNNMQTMACLEIACSMVTINFLKKLSILGETTLAHSYQ